jgi:hypothetical protein
MCTFHYTFFFFSALAIIPSGVFRFEITSETPNVLNVLLSIILMYVSFIRFDFFHSNAKCFHLYLSVQMRSSS